MLAPHTLACFFAIVRRLAAEVFWLRHFKAAQLAIVAGSLFFQTHWAGKFSSRFRTKEFQYEHHAHVFGIALDSAAMGLADAKLKADPNFILVCIL